MNRFPLYFVLVCALAFVVGCEDKKQPAAPTPVDDGSADVAKGMDAMGQQDFKTAAESFAVAAGKCETNFEARLQLTLAHLALGEVAEADRRAGEALTLQPESAEARLAAGQAAYLKKDYVRALNHFNAVAKEKALPAALRSQALVSRGVVELAENQFDMARISFLRGMRMDRRNAAAWYHLGILSRNTYHFDEAALEQFEMALRLSHPKETHAVKMSREIIPALRASIARAATEKPGVAKRDPGAAAKLIAEAESLQKKKMISAAIKKFKAAFEADPLSYPAALGYAQLLEKNDKTSAGVDKALAAYRAAIDQKPAAQANYIAAARLAYANGRWATASQIMERAVAHEAENRATLDLLIASLLKSGKPKQAEAWKSYRNEL